MKTPERSIEEIVEEFDIDNFTHFDSGDMIVDGEGIKDWLTQTLQSERQKREEMVEEILDTVGKERDLSPAKKYWFLKGIESVAERYGIIPNPSNPK